MSESSGVSPSQLEQNIATLDSINESLSKLKRAGRNIQERNETIVNGLTELWGQALVDNGKTIKALMQAGTLLEEYNQAVFLAEIKAAHASVVFSQILKNQTS